MLIDSDFDGGAIDLLGAPTGGHADLHIRQDNAAEFRQWFQFRVRGEAGAAHVFRLRNAGEATYSPTCWRGYRAAASEDLERWFRVPTTFKNGVLTFHHRAAAAVTYYSYFAGYSLDRHRGMVTDAEASPLCRVESLGESVQGRSMDLLRVGEDDGRRRRIWVIARQHPGETMAAWFVEGMMAKLLDEDDELTRRLLDEAVFYVVPNMNPDGGVLGNQRSNAAGMNLNRVWDDPSMETSPEVALVRARIEETGVDLFLDVHGDEDNPYVFAAGCEGNPGYTGRLAALEARFAAKMVDNDRDFQRTHGYDLDEPGKADLSMASNWVGEAFDCLSLTLEMPFTDDADHPEPEGWSPERCAGFGGSTLETVLDVVGELR